MRSPVLAAALLTLVACGDDDLTCPTGTHLADGACVATDGSVPRDMPGGDAGPCGVCGEGLVCDEDTLACVGCLSDAECTTAEASVCGETNECGACATDADCGHDGLPAACVAGVGCFACNEDDTESDDCTGAAPVCDATSRECRACTEHTECAAGLCLDGTCPAEGDILWVDRDDDACDDAGSGTSAAPFCQIQAALDDGSGELIAVRDSVSPYAPIELSSGGTAFVIGVQPEGPTPRINQQLADDTAVAVKCINASTLTLVGVNASGNEDSGAGISATNCNLTLVGVTVSGNGGAGLVASAGGNVTVRRSRFSGNTGGGLGLNSVRAVVENTVIGGAGPEANGGPAASFGGCRISNPMPGSRFINNTVVNNTAPGAAADGIICISAVDIINSIVWDNEERDLSSMCNAVSSHVDGTAPGFAADGYHLTAASTCCVDQGTDTDAPADDIDGDERPCGESIDIGADELCP